MNKLLFATALLFASTSFADQLHNYDQVKSAVVAGKSIRIFIDFSKCATSSKNAHMPSYLGLYSPNEIAINDDAGYIAASLLHFTLNNPAFPSKPVYEFTRYTISNDNTVVMSDTPLNAGDFKPLNEKLTFTCKLDESARIYV
jgi:hypothetical protein